MVGQFCLQGVSLNRIHRQRDLLARELGVKHPFAHVKVRSDGKSLFAILDPERNRVHKIGAGQYELPAVVREFLQHLDYDPTTNMATRWRIAPGIVLDPKRNFGAPTIEGSRLSPYAIANVWAANHRRDNDIAGWYHLTPEQVRQAVAFALPEARAA